MPYREIIVVVLRSTQNTHMRFVVHEVTSGLYNTDLFLLSLEAGWHYWERQKPYCLRVQPSERVGIHCEFEIWDCCVDLSLAKYALHM